jgi:hypothetical protein
MLCLFRRQFRLTSERTLPLPGRGEHVGHSDFSLGALRHWYKEHKENDQRSIYDTSAYLGHVYRATFNPRRLRVSSGAEDELPDFRGVHGIGATLANEETGSSILQGGQSKASAGPEARWGTAYLRTTPYASNFEIAQLTQPRVTRYKQTLLRTPILRPPRTL